MKIPDPSVLEHLILFVPAPQSLI
uniref:Uncharacterized protein n=1 Tax=Anguilla anguilla TaxID=7936 RepID=A0A0E9TCV3_ANGAN